MWSRVRLALLASCVVLFAGCGGCDDETGSGGTSGGTTGGDVYGGDGSPGDGVVQGDGTASATGDGTASGTDGDGGGSGSDDDCSGTERWCDGGCVSTRLNPDHCDTCNKSCGSDEVCNSGQCVDAEEIGCPEGMENCDGECVDFDIDDDNCGSCGNECSDGEACGNTGCVTAIDVDDQGPANCQGGTDIEIGYTDEKEVCSGTVAKTTFKWGVCSCDSINLMNNVYTDAYDSQSGPYTPGGYGGSFGANGGITIEKGEIYGSLWTSSDEGFESSVEAQVKQQLHSQGDGCFGPTAVVDGDARIGGDIRSCTGEGGSGGGPIEFNKTLYIPSSSNIHQRTQANNIVNQNVDVSTVCERCKEENRVPIEQIVKHHAKDQNNDNDAIGLDADALDQPGEDVVLKLPCGRYFLSTIDIVESKVTVVATGNTALFVDGDVNANGDFTIKPSTSGELDVFINGAVELQNQVDVGSPAYPAYTRMYANGLWQFKNDGVFGAFVYAIPGGINLMNNLEYFGGLYTQSFTTMNLINVHYDREVLDLDRDCPEPDDGGGGGDGGDDAGGGTGGDDAGGTTADGGSSDGGTTCTPEGDNCSTNSECCNNLLCDNGTCGSDCAESGDGCSSDGDCCSPLVCSDGTCGTSSCNNLYESCSQDSDCCSGLCACSGSDCQCLDG